MVDEAKLAKAGDTHKGQSQQDEPRTPADLAIKGAETQGGPPEAATADGRTVPPRRPPA